MPDAGGSMRAVWRYAAAVAGMLGLMLAVGITGALMIRHGYSGWPVAVLDVAYVCAAFRYGSRLADWAER